MGPTAPITPNLLKEKDWRSGRSKKKTNLTEQEIERSRPPSHEAKDVGNTLLVESHGLPGREGEKEKEHAKGGQGRFLLHATGSPTMQT